MKNLSEKIFQDDRYLCNDFPNMEKAYYLYRYLKKNLSVDKGELQDDMDFDIDNALRTLDIAGLSKREGQGLSVKRTPTIIRFLDLSKLMKFKLQFLHSLRKRTAKERNNGELRWSNQSHVLLQYKIMVEENIRYFDVRDDLIIDKLKSELKQKQYRPTNRRNNPISLNDKKLRYWKCVCDFLGLTNSGKTLYESSLVIDPETFHSILKCCFKNKKEIDLKDLIDFIDKNFMLFPLNTTVSPPQIYPPFSEIFHYLDIKNLVTLKEEGDAYSHTLKNTRRKNKKVNRVKINE